MKQMSDEKAILWEKQRAKGKWFYILQTGISWSVLMILFTYFQEWYSKGTFELSYFSVFLYFLFGFILGLVGWFWNDGKYQDYLLNKKIEKV